jgi:hypothetical protein
MNRPNKNAPRNFNNMFNDSLLQYDSVHEKSICEDSNNDDVEYENQKRLGYDKFGMENEMCCRRIVCGLWAHSPCAGCDSPGGYTFDLCLKE